MIISTITAASSKKDKLTQIGVLRGGHLDHVTAIGKLDKCEDMILSVSRDKSILVWKLAADGECEGGVRGITGKTRKRYTGHSHFVTSIATSADSRYFLTGSWDRTMRLWDLERGVTTKNFVGHTNDVLSVGFSADNRRIISGSRDKTVKIWNALAKCMGTTVQKPHTGWVSGVGWTIPTEERREPLVVSGSWDSAIKLWRFDGCDLTLEDVLGGQGGHAKAIMCMALSPDATLLATGTKDNYLSTWDVEKRRLIWSMAMPAQVKALSFSPKLYRLVVSVNYNLLVFDLETRILLDEATISTSATSSNGNNNTKPEAICFQWSADGETLYAGYTDGSIRCWKFTPITSYKVDQDGDTYV